MPAVAGYAGGAERHRTFSSEPMSRYVALLRGINVGGKNLIRMAALKACFESEGFRDVVTYIQSGNVLFTTSEPSGAKLTLQIEEILAAKFKYKASVVLRSRKQMLAVVERAPKGFGRHPALHRYDVIFLKEPLTAAAAMKSVLTKEGVDQAHAGSGVLYFSRLIAKATQSRMGRIVMLPIYQNMTIRNWNTTTKLVRMMEASET
jgi:uncharacterized protein (DUF1697 family)